MAELLRRAVGDYDHRRRYEASPEEAEAAVGCVASLTLTGRIVGSGTSGAGTFAKFQVDERWGFPVGQVLVMDLACFDVGAAERAGERDRVLEALKDARAFLSMLWMGLVVRGRRMRFVLRSRSRSAR